MTEVRVDLFHQIRTVLITLVNAPFQRQCLDGIDVRIADDILIMPLDGINPAFKIEAVLYGVLDIRILDGLLTSSVRW
jgi:hypothetical protein